MSWAGTLADFAARIRSHAWFIQECAELRAITRRSVALQGELEITTEAGTGKAAQPGPDGQLRDHVERMPFLMLALDLPPAPLYKDVLEKDIIPQVLRQCLGIAASIYIAYSK